MRFYYDAFRRTVFLISNEGEMVDGMTLVQFEETFGFRATSVLLREVWR